MSPLALVLAGGGGFALLGTGMLLWLRSRERAFRRRLHRVAAPLSGHAEAEDAGREDSVFRPAQGRSWLAGLEHAIEARYPLIKVRQALPKAIGIGIAAGAVCWFSMSFLKVPSGWWTLPAAGVAGAAGGWRALAGIQARRAGEFVRQFPEIVDQIVRLAGAGVPPLEAIAVVAGDARDPVEPVLRSVSDSLSAGLDADTALRTAAERVRLAEFTLFTAVIRLQRRAGGGISSAFSNLAATLRERRSIALKAHASTAQARLTLIVLALMPVAVVTMQTFVSPESVELLFGTDQGTFMLRLGAGLVVLGIFVAKTIATRSLK